MSAELKVLEAEPLGAGIKEALGEVLVMAERGELSSVAIAYVYRDGSIGGSNSAPPSRPLLVGSLAYLQQRMIDRGLNG
jgi:hypothetical protein